MTDRQLIARIGQIRARNNGYWMRLVTLAFAADPIRARRVFRRIVAADAQIGRLAKRLTDLKR